MATAPEYRKRPRPTPPLLRAGEGWREGDCKRFLQRLRQAAFAATLLFTPLGQAVVAEESSASETQQAIERGARFLYKNQNAAGWWSNAELPALTALALVALEMADVANLDA